MGTSLQQLALLSPVPVPTPGTPQPIPTPQGLVYPSQTPPPSQDLIFYPPAPAATPAVVKPATPGPGTMQAAPAPYYPPAPPTQPNAPTAQPAPAGGGAMAPPSTPDPNNPDLSGGDPSQPAQPTQPGQQPTPSPVQPASLTRPITIPTPGVRPGVPTPPGGVPRWQTMQPGQLYSPQGLPPLFYAIARPESGLNNRNVGDGGLATGYLQIQTPTWRDFAPKAGVDLNRWPTAASAPIQVQWAVAQTIPLNRWTAGKDGALAMYPWADPSMTVGQIQAAAALGGPQTYIPAQGNRGPDEWGSTPVGGYQPGPGNMPQGPSDFQKIMQRVAQFVPLLSIFAKGSALPMLQGFGSFMTGYQHGQILAQQQAHQVWKDNLEETTERMKQESMDAGDAFAAYGNDPDKLGQALVGVAQKYGDNALGAALSQGGLAAAHKLLQNRDAYFTDLMKTRLAVEEQQEKVDAGKRKAADQASQDAAVAALDQEYLKEHPGASPGEMANIHQINVGKVAAERKPPSATASGEEAPIRDVIGPDGKPTGQQVREGKSGGYFDPSSGQQVTLKTGETTSPEPKAGGAGEGLEVSKLYDVVDDHGNVIQSGIELREGKNKSGFVHSEDGSPLVLKPGEHVKQTTPTTTSGGRAGAQTLRQMVGGREVLSDLQNVSKLHVGTTTGPFNAVRPGPTIGGALTGDLVRKMTDQESQLMQASLASLGRELSTLMSPVYGGHWAAEAIEPLMPKTGDTLGTVMFKIARIKQTADNALEALQTAPWLTPDQKKYAQGLRDEMNKAIKWDTSQALDFATRGQKGQTFDQFVEGGGLDKGKQQAETRPSWAVTDPEGQRKMPDGRTVYTDGNGWFYADHTPVQ